MFNQITCDLHCYEEFKTCLVNWNPFKWTSNCVTLVLQVM